MQDNKGLRLTLSWIIRLSILAFAVTNSGCGGSSVPVDPGDRTVVDVASNGMYYDAFRNQLWSTVSNTGKYANSIVAIDPATGAIMRSIKIGAEPNLICVTDDGQFAYVSVPSDGTVRRVDLIRSRVTLKITTGTLVTICPVPGDPHTFLGGVDPTGGVSVSAYDDGVRRNGTGAGGNFIRMASPTVMYGTGSTSLVKCTLSPGQITWNSQTEGLINADFGIHNGLLFDANGHVVDPVALTSVGQLSTTHFLPNGRHIALSDSDNRAYIVTWDAVINKQLLCYDLTTQQELPQRDTGFIPGGAFDIVACGNHTVAFRDYGAIVEPNKIFIFRNLP
ncbi:MAG: hypothetical protein WCI55_11355 [Armatimonadota bacterium]